MTAVCTSHLAVWRSHFNFSETVRFHFVTALLASRSDQPACARSNRKEQKKSTFGQPLERAKRNPRCGHFLPSKGTVYTLGIPTHADSSEGFQRKRLERLRLPITKALPPIQRVILATRAGTHPSRGIRLSVVSD